MFILPVSKLICIFLFCCRNVPPNFLLDIVSSVNCCCSFTQLCLTVCNPIDCSPPGFPVLHHLLELEQTCTFSRWCHLTISFSVSRLSSCLQSFPASEYFPMSHHFASGGQSIGPSALAEGYSSGCSWLISFRIDWFDFLAVKGTLKTLFQHHSLKASTLQCSAIFVVQISHFHMTAGKKQHSFAYMDHCRQSDVSAF